MNTDKTLEIVSHSLEDTLQIAKKVGANLKGGETIELASDIGGGKTSFVRGLVAGVNSPDQVASPTFTVSRHYRTIDNAFEIRHFDFYRLSDPGLMKSELSEAIELPDVVVIVEWSDIVKDVLPKDRLRVEITATGEDTRHLSFIASENYNYLLNGISQ